MAEFYLDAEDAISDFLRVRLTDPKARAEASESQNDTATAGQTQITLTPTAGTVSCITALTVNAVAQVKWRDYFWDYQNEKITFFTALSLNDAVITTYKFGTKNWIYSDKPDEELTAASFPRISLFTISASGKRLGQFEAPVESSSVLQIDIWSKDGYVKTIDSRKYSNNYLTRYLGNQVTRAFEKFESDLHPELYSYEPVSGVRTAPYSFEYQAFHSIVEINIKGLKLGRIEV